MKEKNQRIRNRALKLIANMEYSYSYECSGLLKIIMDLIKENEKLENQQEALIRSLLTDVEL